MRRRPGILFWLLTTCLLLGAAILGYGLITWSPRSPLEFHQVRKMVDVKVYAGRTEVADGYELTIRNTAHTPIYMMYNATITLEEPGASGQRHTMGVLGKLDASGEPGHLVYEPTAVLICPARSEVPATAVLFYGESANLELGKPVIIRYEYLSGTKMQVGRLLAWLHEHLPETLTSRLPEIGVDSGAYHILPPQPP